MASDATQYRRRAREMRAQAGRAETEQLRASYLAIAEDWARMAEEADAVQQAQRAMPPQRHDGGLPAKV